MRVPALHEEREHTTKRTTVHGGIHRTMLYGSAALQSWLRRVGRVLVVRARPRGRRRGIHKRVARNNTRLSIRTCCSDQQDAANLASIRRVCSQDGRPLLVGASKHLARRRCECDSGRDDGAAAGGISRGEDDGGLRLGRDDSGALVIYACCGYGHRGGGLAEDGTGDDGSTARVVGRSRDGNRYHNSGAAGRRGFRALRRVLGRRRAVRRRVLPLHLQVLHRSYDELGSERGVFLVYALDAVAIRLEDAVTEVAQAVQGRMQRFFRQGIEQVLERLVRVGVEGLHVLFGTLLGRRGDFLAGDVA